MKVDARTWIIVGLAAALLAVIFAVPMLRENLATWLVWLGGLLGAGAHEAGRRSEESAPEPDPETAADDLGEAIDEQTADEQTADGDALYDDWREIADD